MLDDVQFEVADLDGLTLGLTEENMVFIDSDAAGYGWFIDTTPLDDVEFSPSGDEGVLTAFAGSEAVGDMDLLTVVMHELGHVLGYEDLSAGEADFMSATLDSGERQLPDDGDSGLVVMDTNIDSAEEPVLAAAAHSHNSWLMDFLVQDSRANDNPFEPKEDISIVLYDNQKELK